MARLFPPAAIFLALLTAAPAAASQLVDRNASNVSLAVNDKGRGAPHLQRRGEDETCPRLGCGQRDRVDGRA